MNNIPNQPTFSIRKALSYGFKTYFNNLLLVLGCFLIIVATMVAANMILYFIFPFRIMATPHTSFFIVDAAFAVLAFCIPIAQWVIAQWFTAGFIKVALELHDTNHSSFKTLFSCHRLLAYFIATSLLYSLMIGLGFICLIIPGLYFMARYHFAIWSVVDGHAWIINAFKYSSLLTRGIRGKLFVYSLAFIAISIIPIFIPVGIFGLAYIYRWAQQRYNKATIY